MSHPIPNRSLDQIEKLAENAEEFLGSFFLVTPNTKRAQWDIHNEKIIRNLITPSDHSDRPLKIAYLSSYSAQYTRTETLKALFNTVDADVDYFIYPGNYARLLLQTFKIRNQYDIFFIGFRGHEILPFIRLILGSRKKLIFDAFVSVYDTLCNDRKRFKPGGFFGKLLKKYDTFLCSIANVVLVDTYSHKEYFEREFLTGNVEVIYVSCNKSLFKKHTTEGGGYIFWYGAANPLQGIENILQWAKSLEGHAQFILAGPIKKKYEDLVTQLAPSNIKFIDYIPYEELPEYMSNAILCLGGHFSTNPKAQRVIAGKTFQMLECCDHVLLADNPANREIFPEA